jgi:Glyoxalase/Bleomycin resistance protein/Dioxygenase superfamily
MQTHKLRVRQGWAALTAMALCGCFGAAIAAPGEVRPQVIVVGKTVNYRQAADGGLTRLNYHFFAEISLPPGLQGGTARLIDPDGRVIFFQPSGNILSIPGKRDLTTLADLNAYAPNGDYEVQFDAPPARAVRGIIPLNATEEALADPVHLTLLQDGQTVSPGAVEVGKPLTVAWSSFRKGRSDTNGIVDDLIFVHVGDCRGQIIARSPTTFAEKPALTYRSPSYTIAANTLEAGEIYQIDVEHAPLQTRRLTDVTAGVPALALATYPATTYLDFHTQGAGSNTCPEKPYRMDNGQSDRQRAPVAASTTPSEQGIGEGMRGQTDRPAAVSSVTDQVTFLYYDDLTAPRRFYSDTLGLTAYFETERVSLFHTTLGATIGLVKVPRTGVTPAVKRSVVMVSIVTNDVAGWYKKLKQDPHIHIAKDLYDHPRAPIRAFEVEDPGGYPIEFFQWLTERR